MSNFVLSGGCIRAPRNELQSSKFKQVVIFIPLKLLPLRETFADESDHSPCDNPSDILEDMRQVFRLQRVSFICRVEEVLSVIWCHSRLAPIVARAVAVPPPELYIAVREAPRIKFKWANCHF